MACITKKKSKKGQWCIDFYDQYGKRRLKVLPKDATKTEAKKVLREIEDQVEKRIFMPTRNIPLFSEVAEDWLEFKKPNVRASTWDGYQAHLEHHFDEINHLKINRITTPTVEKFIAYHLKEGMSIPNLKKVLVTFNQVMKYAVRHRYLDYNPVRDAERPRGRGEDAGKDAAIQILTPSEINRLIEAEKDLKYKTLFRLSIMSGARQGELLGLKWTDVDWFNNQIHIQRTFNKGRWYKPKSKESKRKIDLGPTTMAGLKSWKLACPPNDLDLVFPNEAGQPLNHANMLSRHFFPALKKAGTPRIRFHDLRHTYASLLIDQGENIKYIQNQLGHSSPIITLDVYAHLMKPVNQEAACRLERSVFETNGDQMETKTKKGATE